MKPTELTIPVYIGSRALAESSFQRQYKREEVTVAEVMEQDGPVADEERSYTQAEVDKLGAQGKAYKNSDGHYSFPIDNVQDLKNAIQAFGRAAAGEQAGVKAFIIKRANALGQSALIPDSWDQKNEADVEVEEREVDEALEYRREKAKMLRGVIEHREFTSDLECRSLGDGTLRMGGYASLTEQPYTVGQFQETIKRNAFKRTLAEQPDTSLLINHDGIPLARTTNGSLVLEEDAKGLKWTADLDPADPASVALARKVETGLLDQCSFAFFCTNDSWNDDMTERTVTSLSLDRGDVSVVTHGANSSTSVGLRALAQDFEERAGKSISAKHREDVEAIVSAGQRLLAADDKDTIVDVAADAVADQEIEVVAEPEPVARTIVLPNHTARARERLAQLRRVA